ncbi:MAG: type II toxin-antitoxin system HicB family antitoxin [Chloroflexi bacterium]|nr:type II toxin-antitoxin system HicB family antitoxin [Chloroflexota bacterium]
MKTTTERKPLDYYLGLKYPVTITPEPGGGFVAEIGDLPGCVSEGDTLDEAYDNVEEARQLWLESAYEDGLDIPLPRDQRRYSGKFNVRVPRDLHRKLDELAEREGVSLNQFLVSTLSRAIGPRETRRARTGRDR